MPHLTLSRLRPLGAGAAAVATLALTGCGPGILSQSYQQNDEIGNAQVNQTLCATINSSKTPATCASGTNYSNQEYSYTQYLLGYQVRDDVTAPASIASSNDAVVDASTTPPPTLPAGAKGVTSTAALDETVDYTQSPTYTAELQKLYPAPAGQHWVGYLSNVQTPIDDLLSISLGIGLTPVPIVTATGHRPPDQWDVNPQFTLQQPAGGPFTGPFAHASTVGYRTVNAPANSDSGTGAVTVVGTNADDDVVCYAPSQLPPAPDELTTLARAGDVAGLTRSLHGGRGDTVTDPTGNSYCNTGDDQDPSTAPTGRVVDNTARYAGFAFVGHPELTRDLWLGGSGDAIITQGTSGAVNFTAKFAGAAGPAFGMTATTDLAGAGLAPQPGTFAPAADSTTGVPVVITVPADAAVGPHTVVLTANGVNGQRRTATATYNVALRIVAPSRSAAARVTIKHRFLVRLVNGAKERVRLACPANSTGCGGTLMFKSRFGNSNTLKYSLKAGESKTYVLTPSKKLVRYLHKHKKTALGTATVYVTNGGDAATTPTTSNRTIHISPRHKK